MLIYLSSTRATELTRHVSGGAFYFFATEEEARCEFQRAVHDGVVVKVIPSIRVVLTRQDLSGVPGFRVGDPCK